MTKPRTAKEDAYETPTGSMPKAGVAKAATYASLQRGRLAA